MTLTLFFYNFYARDVVFIDMGRDGDEAITLHIQVSAYFNCSGANKCYKRHEKGPLPNYLPFLYLRRRFLLT